MPQDAYMQPGPQGLLRALPSSTGFRLRLSESDLPAAASPELSKRGHLRQPLIVDRQGVKSIQKEEGGPEISASRG